MRTVESSWYYIQRRRSCLPYQPPNPPPQKNKQQQTNEKYTHIVQPCGTSNHTSWNIWESSTLLIECLSVSSLLVCQSTLCLHLPQCSELTCCCLIILYYAKLFIKKNLLLTMYYKENCMWNSIIVTTVRWIAINDLILYFFRFWHAAVVTIYRGISPENPNTLT